MLRLFVRASHDLSDASWRAGGRARRCWQSCTSEKGLSGGHFRHEYPYKRGPDSGVSPLGNTKRSHLSFIREGNPKSCEVLGALISA
ncbi:hypothetical protein E2C01_003732 [Portunus trituberculatus]|uniref:Uncharacterized protein n=1 Tax=Portunus trituberculatus TaxID=210409 RepID=A0A5B7CNG8_PORTR|nr:hypothetical protein [Portunus trituberculatus]